MEMRIKAGAWVVILLKKEMAVVFPEQKDTVGQSVF